MPRVAFGTAQLYGLAGDATSGQLLDEAWRVGIRRFDTAPSYGGGRSEQQLGEFLAGREGVEVVTTKVGLAPAVGTRRGGRGLVALAKAVLPEPVAARLRRSAHAVTGGRFAPPEVTASVEESLRRLGGRIDRFLLHEVQPDDVTPELLDVLAALVRRGDVGAVGVATQNGVTPAVLAAGGDLLTVAHIGVGPLHEPVTFPEHVTTRVGHGLLGSGGDQLRRLHAVLAADPGLTDRWRAATAGTDFEGQAGLADALLSRGPQLDVTDLLVATTRVEQVGRTYALAAREEPLATGMLEVLAALVQRSGAVPG